MADWKATAMCVINSVAGELSVHTSAAATSEFGVAPRCAAAGRWSAGGDANPEETASRVK